MKKLYALLSIFVLGSFVTINAQQLYQNIKGQVIDKQSQQSLPGATVTIPGSIPLIVSSTDANGNFKLSNIPVGRVTILISYVGYETASLSNLYLISGKELILNIELEEKVQSVEEVTITANKSKAKPINDMALISARSFTVEETEKYAGSRGDIARMASNYAGVSFANDSRNDIIIRGNSPTGLLWRLEDVDVPNPNHFAENGTTGGPVGMLNNNVLRNSDFFTGAFPAEYGNALSGVFDLKMRNGNNEKHEFLLQSGFNGFELGAEGPLAKSKRSSYLVNYRYSTLEVLDKLGVNFGTAGVPKYQDINFKFTFPLNKGMLTIFGLAGKSQIAMLDSKRKENDFYTSQGMDLYNQSEMATSGISYTRYINNKTYVKFILSGLYQWGGTKIDTLDTNNPSSAPFRYLNHGISESRVSLTMISGTKFSSRLSSKTGITVDQMGYKLSTDMYDYNSKKLSTLLDNEKKLGNGPHLFRTYYELSYKITDQLSFNPGMHFIYFDLNQKASLEPRLGLSWSYAKNRKINIGYGLHSRAQALSTYYLGTSTPDGKYEETNKNLDFTRSHQFVVGHDWNISKDLRLKTEVYYQYLFEVPVETRPSFYSILNTGAYWGVGAEDSLQNKGTGQNYGFEMTFEKFFSNGYYFLITTSIFDSKYTGSNGKERNTAFNGNFVMNTLVGKEFILGPKSTLNLDLKISWAGGKRYTPIDTLNSNIIDTKYIENEVFTHKFPSFFKTDFKVGFKLNSRKISQEWQAYVENITNHQNILQQTYNAKTAGKVKNSYQLGFFPMVLYRINF